MSAANWPRVKLGEVLHRSAARITLKPNTRYREVTVRLWGKGVTVRREVDGMEVAATDRFLCSADQFIVSRIDARNGAFGLVPPELDGAIVTNDFPLFDVEANRLDVRFLSWLSKTAGFVELCKAASEGTTNRVRLKEDAFLATPIPLPPPNEQRRIVARVDAIADRIAAARQLREEASTEAVTLLPAALNAAIEAQNWPRRRIEDCLAEDTRNGIGTKPSEGPEGVPILRISAGTSRSDFLVDERDHKYLPDSLAALAEYVLRPGDLLGCRFNGNLRFVGRFSLYSGTSGRPQVYPDKLIRFRFDSAVLLPAFGKYALNTPAIREEIEGLCATTAGNIGISASQLKTVSVAVPPLPEQRRIVAHLDALQAKADALKSLQAESAAELAALLPAVLAKAFAGEL